MLNKELRQPWCIAAMALLVAAIFTVLADRWRTPAWQWRSGGDGMPGNTGQLVAKRHLDSGLPVDNFGYLADGIGSVADNDKSNFPKRCDCEHEEGLSPLALSPETKQAVQAYNENNARALAMVYEVAGQIPLLYPRGEKMVWESQTPVWDKAARMRKLQTALYYDMLGRTMAHDASGAVRAVETMFKIAGQYAPSVDPMGQQLRLGYLKSANDAVAVLVNRLELDEAQWQTLTEMVSGAQAGLINDLRDSFEFAAMEALEHYEPSGALSIRDRYYSNGYEEVRWEMGRFPRHTNELALDSLFTLAGGTWMDQLLMVRFSKLNQASFTPGNGLALESQLNHFRMGLTQGAQKLRWTYSNHERIITQVYAFPKVFAAAAAIDCYRRAHGNVPASLGELEADCLDSQQDPVVLLKDPLRDGPLQYRPFDGGVKVYSVGRDGQDSQEASTRMSYGDDDIAIRLFDLRGN